ncbi:MAG: hypothetical protein KDA42_16265 [Planctomycetales bacterium]|nr:hypothetical protein [Planctomycetales bacterium]
MFRLRRFIVVALLSGFALSHTCAAEYSKLWGQSGELWRADGRLPDFSFAGYRRGEAETPHVNVAADVTNFGANGSDDKDDTAAFQQAIAETDTGAIFVPAGRYLVSDLLEINKPNVVLRGAGSEKSILYFPVGLEDVRPNMGETTTGRPTSNYSWSGGFVWIKGSDRAPRQAQITAAADRGAHVLAVDEPGRLKSGQDVRLVLRDDERQSLVRYLYQGDTGPTQELQKRHRLTSFVARVVSVAGQTVTIDRPLPFDVRPEWRPELVAFEPSVREVGIESLGFEFPNRPYAGHFTERGANAIAMSGVRDCWARDIRIHNSDSGIFVTGTFCTVENVVFTSERVRDKQRHSTGHHGIQVTGDDNLVRRFDFQTRFIHDLTVAHCRGNVFGDGRGEDLSLDHHKYAPYANLFTNLDAGAGTQLWICGGGAALGKNTAAWATFWNIRAKRPLAWPPASFCPERVNLVGLTTEQPSVLQDDGRWFEAIAPSELTPQNLWEAQRGRRVGN